MNAKESVVFMFKGVSNWAPIGSFILGREGDLKLGTLLAVSFWGGSGGFELGTILAVSFWQGGRGGTSAGRLANFDSFSEIGY